jgi:hypothetical protein
MVMHRLHVLATVRLTRAVLPGMIGCTLCAVAYILLARDWPAEIGIPPYGATSIQPPPATSAGNAVAMSFNLLREASSSRAFWVIAGTFFICGLSTSGVVQQSVEVGA